MVTLQGMARVRSGQAAPDPWFLAGVPVEAPRSRVAAGHLRSKREAPLTVEGRVRTLSGPSPAPCPRVSPRSRPSPVARWSAVNGSGQANGPPSQWGARSEVRCHHHEALGLP
jgi:hypothetical protein